MEERFTGNEPTTGEIVRALRYCADVNSMCGDACPAHLDGAGCRTVLMQNAADRLESQGRTIAESDAYIELLKKREEALENDAINYDMNLSEMTARAESAERERDAAMSFMAAVQSIMSDILLDNIPQRPAITERIRNSIAIWNTYLRGKSQEGGGK